MYELLASASRLSNPSVPTPTDTSSLKIAIITAISVVIAAAITAAATTIQRRRDHQNTADVSQDFIAELQRRATTAEAQVASLTERYQSSQQRVDELEDYCWQNGVDPRTGEPVRGNPPADGER